MNWSLNYSKSFITHSHNPFSYINLKNANESLYFLTDFNTNKLLNNLIDCSTFLIVVINWQSNKTGQKYGITFVFNDIIYPNNYWGHRYFDIGILFFQLQTIRICDWIINS